MKLKHIDAVLSLQNAVIHSYFFQTYPKTTRGELEFDAKNQFVAFHQYHVRLAFHGGAM